MYCGLRDVASVTGRSHRSCAGATFRIRHRPSVLVKSSYSVGRWPDAQFVQETKDQYLGQGIYAKPLANAEEARVLLSCGYVWLDIRPASEVELGGAKVPGSVNIPFTNATRKYDLAEKQWVVKTSPNAAFLQQVEKAFPKKDTTLLLVADSNGRNGAEEALSILEEARYENLVGVVGGFAAFRRVFDAKLARRASRGAFREDPWAEGSSQGIFAGES